MESKNKVNVSNSLAVFMKEVINFSGLSLSEVKENKRQSHEDKKPQITHFGDNFSHYVDNNSFIVKERNSNVRSQKDTDKISGEI